MHIDSTFAYELRLVNINWVPKYFARKSYIEIVRSNKRKSIKTDNFFSIPFLLLINLRHEGVARDVCENEAVAYLTSVEGLFIFSRSR